MVLPLPTPGAGAPPGMGPPPAATGAGPAAMPGGMGGSVQHGMAALKVGLEALQKALPQLPLGSTLHQAVLKALTDIGKQMEKQGGSGNDQAGAIQQLVDMARTAKTQPAMAGMMPGGAPPAGGAPGGAPPPPPMPPAGA